MSALKYTLIRVHPETGVPEALLAGTKVPAWAMELVHEDDLESKSADDDKGYSGLKVAELKELIAERNEGRDEDNLIPDTGNKAELAAALEAADEPE